MTNLNQALIEDVQIPAEDVQVRAEGGHLATFGKKAKKRRRCPKIPEGGQILYMLATFDSGNPQTQPLSNPVFLGTIPRTS